MVEESKHGGCDPELMREHEGRLSKVESDLKNNMDDTERAHKRMDNLEDFKAVMYKIGTNVEVLAEQMKSIMSTLVRHDEKIENIEKSMENKESFARLHGKVEELEAMVQQQKDDDRAELTELIQVIQTQKEEEQKAKLAEKQEKIDEFESYKKYLLKIIIGGVLFVVIALLVFAVIVLAGLANSGNLPIPDTEGVLRDAWQYSNGCYWSNTVIRTLNS